MWEEKTGGELCCLAAFDFFEVLEKDLIHREISINPPPTWYKR